MFHFFLLLFLLPFLVNKDVQMNGLRQLRDATGAHKVGWRSPTVDDNETASQQHGEESQTGIEEQYRAEIGIQGPPAV